MIDTQDWSWNKWTRLDTKTDPPAAGLQGTLKACYEGDDNCQDFDFEFAEVDNQNHVLAWKGSVGCNGCLFNGYHQMRLEQVTADETKLTHTEEFGGLLPALKMGL